jgi:hypothetical protein
MVHAGRIGPIGAQLPQLLAANGSENSDGLREAVLVVREMPRENVSTERVSVRGYEAPVEPCAGSNPVLRTPGRIRLLFSIRAPSDLGQTSGID